MVLAALVISAPMGCGIKNTCTEFPAADGYQPLEPLDPGATPLPPTLTDAHPQGLGPIVAVQSHFSHFTSHASGYLHYPLAKVYQALAIPHSSYLHNQNGATQLDRPTEEGVEPAFPISFLVHYRNDTDVAGKTVTTRFDVAYRAGPLDGTVAAPITVGQRYKKTCGVENIHVMDGSLRATAVDANTTLVEMIAWLSATTQGQADCNGTLTDLFGELATTLASLPP